MATRYLRCLAANGLRSLRLMLGILWIAGAFCRPGKAQDFELGPKLPGRIPLGFTWYGSADKSDFDPAIAILNGALSFSVSRTFDAAGNETSPALPSTREERGTAVHLRSLRQSGPKRLLLQNASPNSVIKPSEQLAWRASDGNSNDLPASMVTGSVRQVLPSAESAFYVMAVIAVQNHRSRPVSVTRLRLEWPGGSYTGPTRPLALAANEARDWRVRVNPDSGDLGALLKDRGKARVVILDAR